MVCESTGPTIIAAPDTETSAPIEDAATPSVSPELFVTTPARGTWLTRDDLPAGTSIEIQGTMTHPESDSGLAIERAHFLHFKGFTQAITPKRASTSSVRVDGGRRAGG